jgi:AcrR family transcriptional regulator
MASRTEATRERILGAATELFYGQGINTTGVEEISAVAKVSKRTLYKHFVSKDALVQAYLEAPPVGLWQRVERSLENADMPPRERLLAIFDVPEAEIPTRGCPFAGAALERPDPDHPAHQRAAEFKLRLTHRLIDVAAEAGAGDPEALGRQLAMLYAGAAVITMIYADPAPIADARAAAAAIVAAGVPS